MSSFVYIYINVYIFMLEQWDHVRSWQKITRSGMVTMAVVTHIFRHMIYRYGHMKTIFVRDIFDARRWSYSVLWNHCLSVRPSVRPSLSLLKIGSLIFSDIAWDDSWPWYLVTGRDRFLKKKIGPNGLKLGPKLGFLSFSEVWFISFLRTCIQWYLATMSNI